MHSKKQRILHLEATTRRRRNDLRREFNRRLVQMAMSTGGKRKGDDGNTLPAKRPKANISSLSRLPSEIQFKILEKLDCQDIIGTISYVRLPKIYRDAVEGFFGIHY